MPGQGECRPASLAGFGHGGAWAGSPPSAGLAAALEAAAGPEDLYEGAETGDLVGIARQWAAVESWAAAGKLAALRAMMRENGGGVPLLRRRGDLPEGWDDSLNYEVAGALAVGPVSAGNLASLAWTLGARLSGIGGLLAGGTLTVAKAKLIAAVFEPLDEGEAARAEALLVGEVAGKTYFQVERLAWRAALAVAPEVAERRRSGAERERARVTVFREESGAVGLSGRDLPAAQALAGHANVVARAGLYEASGAFPGQTTSGLQALAYLHLLNGVTAGDAIAFARTAAEPPDRPTTAGLTTAGLTTAGVTTAGLMTRTTTPRAARQAAPPALPATPGATAAIRAPMTTMTTRATAVSRAAVQGRVTAAVRVTAWARMAAVTARAGQEPGWCCRRSRFRWSPCRDARPGRGRTGCSARSTRRWPVTWPRPRPVPRSPAGNSPSWTSTAMPSATASRAPGAADPAAAAAAGPGRLRVPGADQHHRHRDAAAAAGGRAALRRPAGGVGPRPASGRRLGTYPARRPGTGRAVRRGAHARLRPQARGQQLRAEPAAAPPDRGPRSRVHVPALLAARARVGF